MAMFLGMGVSVGMECSGNGNGLGMGDAPGRTGAISREQEDAALGGLLKLLPGGGWDSGRGSHIPVPPGHGVTALAGDSVTLA